MMTVTLTLATSCGHALIGRALYLPGACAADEEHRELAGVLEEVMFAAKPELAGELLARAHERGIRAVTAAGDEVYGGRQLRRAIRGRGMGYVCRSARTTRSRPARAARLIPRDAWHRFAPGTAARACATTTGSCWR